MSKVFEINLACLIRSSSLISQSPNISQDLQFHIRLHKIIICFDLDMDFLLDNNMVTAIVMINELIHLVKLYHATVIYCEQNV